MKYIFLILICIGACANAQGWLSDTHDEQPCGLCDCKTVGNVVEESLGTGIGDFHGIMCLTCAKECGGKNRKDWSIPMGNVYYLFQLIYEFSKPSSKHHGDSDNIGWRLVRGVDYKLDSVCDTGESEDELVIGYVVKIFYNKGPKKVFSFQLVTLFPDIQQYRLMPDQEYAYRAFMQGFSTSEYNVARYLFHPRPTKLGGGAKKVKMINRLEGHLKQFVASKLLFASQKTSIYIDVVCKVKKIPTLYPRLLQKMKYILKRYEKSAGKQSERALNTVVDELNKQVIEVFEDDLTTKTTKLEERTKCYAYVIAKHFNQLRADTEHLIPDFIPEIGIRHSQIRQLISVAAIQDKKAYGIEVDIPDASGTAEAAALKNFYTY